MVSTSTIHNCGSKFRSKGWQFYTDILQGVDIPAGKKSSLKERVSKKIPRRDFCFTFARNDHIRFSVISPERQALMYL